MNVIKNLVFRVKYVGLPIAVKLSEKQNLDVTI